MEIIAAVAIGLNPYVGTFVLAALASFTDHVPQSAALAAVPAALLTAVTLLAAVAIPLDIVLGKFVRFAPRVRRLSQLVAPASAGLFAAAVEQSELPVPVVVSLAAFTAWVVAAMLTSAAARASRSAAWIGLGHIPVLMAAATAAACIVPLGVAKPAIGFGLVVVALVSLGGATLAGRRAATVAPARPAGATRLARAS